MTGVPDLCLDDLWNEMYFKNNDLWEHSLELTVFQTFNESGQMQSLFDPVVLPLWREKGNTANNHHYFPL